MEALLADLVETQLNTAANLFPRHIVEYLSTNKSVSAPQQMAQLARQHQDVTLLFMDIVGFTALSKEVPPEAVMVFLNTLFALFDSLCDKHGVMKVETAGDCYIVAGGILGLPNNKSGPCSQGVLDDGFTEVLQEHDPVDSASRVMAFAKDMMAASKTVMTPHNNQPVVIRIGMHTGNCVSGLIGQKIPKFAVFGDTMNVASRMESTCIPGRIQLSAATARLLPHEPLRSTGGIQVKGQGMMQTYFLEEPALETLTAEHSPPDAVKPAATPAAFSTAGSMLADGGDDRPTSLRLLNSAMHAANCLSNGSMRRKGVLRASLDWGPQAGPHTSRPTPVCLSQVSLLLPDSGSATPGGGNQPGGSHCRGSPNLSRASCALAVTQGLGGSNHSAGQAAARAAAATKAEKGITVAISQPLQKLRLGRQEDAPALEHLQALQNKATVAATRAPAASRLATKTGAAAARWRTAVAELASAAASRSTAPELVLPRQLVSVIQEGGADRGPGTAGDSSQGLTTKHPAATARQAEPATNDHSKHQLQPKLQYQPQPGDGQHMQSALPLPVRALDAPLPPSGPLPPHASALLPGPTPHLSPAENVFGETSLKPPLTVDSSSPAVEATVHAAPTSSQPAAPLEAQHSAQHSTALVSMMPTPKVSRELTAVPCPDPTKSVTATSSTPQPAHCQPGTAAAPSLAPRVPQPQQPHQQQLQQPSSTPAGPATIHRDRPALRRSTTSPNAGAKQPAVPSNVPSLLMFGPQQGMAREPAPADSNYAALVRSAIQASSSGALRTQPMRRDGCDQPPRIPPGQQQDSCAGSVSFSGTNEVSTSGSATGLFNYAAGMKLLQQAQQQLGGERAASTPSGANALLVVQGGTSARTGRRALKSSRTFLDLRTCTPCPYPKGAPDLRAALHGAATMPRSPGTSSIATCPSPATPCAAPG
ncbi:hypothetical protein V8C86DRAFT_2748763 [Haematococcus lacustris]